MTIRPILPTDDRMAVSLVYEESWKTAYRGIIPDEYLDSIPIGHWMTARTNGPTDRTLLLLDGNEIIGISTVCRSRFPEWPGWGEVVSLYLRPAYMDKGHGGSLLEAAVEALRAQGFDRVFLWVLEENVRARHFYEKHGFTFSGNSREDVIGGKTVREVRYALQKPL